MQRPAYIPLNSDNFDNPVITYNGELEPQSRYQDNVWDFSLYIHNRNVCKSRSLIDFICPLEDGSTLTDISNHRFLNGLKEYLYTRNNVPHPRSGKTLAPQTLISKFYASITVINFLKRSGKACFSMFEANDTALFIAYVKARNPKLANNTLNKYLFVVEDFYNYRDKLSFGIAKHPWPDSSSVHLSQDRKQNGAKYDKQTPCIPDYLAASLFQQSVQYLDDNSNRIIDCYSSLEKRLGKEFWKALKSGKRTNALQSNRPDKHASYLASRTYGYKQHLSKTLTKYGFNNRRALTTAVVKARICCYVILAMTTGMRNSELASLTNESLAKSTGWDDEEYLWLHGYTYKLEDEATPAKWMVPDIVKNAYNHLIEIGLIYNTIIIRSAPYLTSHEFKHQDDLLHHLFIVNDTTTNLFNGISNSSWNANLKKLANEFNLKVKDSNNDLNLPAGFIWPLTSHHFRRTFAVLAARSALGDIRYLREHFKHWSLDMTLHYAKHNDHDDSLFDEVLTERNELQRTLVSDWVATDEPLSGGRGKAIVSFRQRGALKTSSNLKALVNQISDSVHVRGTGHSWCLSSGDGCGGEGVYDAIQCIDCDNAVIDKNLLPMWDAIEKQNLELLELPDIGAGMSSRANKLISAAKSIQEELTLNE